jgi:hypothetical protein
LASESVSWRAALRLMARRVAPTLMADRAHSYQRALYERTGRTALGRQFVTVHGDRVLRGPFVGMRYPPDRVASIPKLLGVYESVLHRWIEQALEAVDGVVNIGAADGYYAVGLARRGLRVDAFESAPAARRDLQNLARLNGVSLAVHGRATASRLVRVASVAKRSLVLSDCEGAEVDIFTSRVVAALCDATVLVETHDAVRPGAMATLRDRFGTTHDVEVATETTRPAADFTELEVLPAEDRERAIDSMRSYPTPWVMFTPRNRG